MRHTDSWLPPPRFISFFVPQNTSKRNGQTFMKFPENVDNSTRNRYLSLALIRITIWIHEYLKDFVPLVQYALLKVLVLGRGMHSPNTLVIFGFT